MPDQFSIKWMPTTPIQAVETQHMTPARYCHCDRIRLILANAKAIAATFRMIGITAPTSDMNVPSGLQNAAPAVGTKVALQRFASRNAPIRRRLQPDTALPPLAHNSVYADALDKIPPGADLGQGRPCRAAEWPNGTILRHFSKSIS